MLATNRATDITQAMLSEVFGTFRLLIDSMDFLDEYGDGWNFLQELCYFTSGMGGSKEAMSDLLLWMLQLSSFELTTNIIEGRYSSMLYWTLRPGPKLSAVSDLLLKLGGDGVIDVTLDGRDGYTVLHRQLVHIAVHTIREVLARGPDLHRQGTDTFHTPYKGSPTSLAMYSSQGFTYWLRALANVDVDLENFIGQELEQNLEVHPGWEKETLLALFTHGDRPDLHAPYSRTCSDCTREIYGLQVQPYWRHLLDQIKERRHPEDAAPPSPEVAEEENADRGSAGEAVSCSWSDPTFEQDTTWNVSLVVPEEEEESESEWEEDGSKQRPKTPIRSDCMYGMHELVCMDCWLYYEETGTRRPLHAQKLVSQAPDADEDSSDDENSPSKDDSSECEYSPFLIHS